MDISKGTDFNEVTAPGNLANYAGASGNYFGVSAVFSHYLATQDLSPFERNNLWNFEGFSLQFVRVPEPSTLALAGLGAAALLLFRPRQARKKSLEMKDRQALFFRTPLNDMSGGYYASDPQRPIARLNKRCNGGFADGHAMAARVSTYGFQFYPGKDANRASATGIPSLGGNGKYDPRWLWDLE